MTSHSEKKIYYSIGEVAEMFKVKVSLIRFWENEFSIIKPFRNKKGTRYFTPKDLDNFHLIYHLVKEKGMTLKGANQQLKDNREQTEKNFEVVKKLKEIKQLLLHIDKQL